MEEVGFEHVSDCGWEWAGMQQFFRVFWHPEERAVAAICLCEQSDVAFAFISITSTGVDGKVWRTTNFPFAPTLQCPPNVKWNHVPCERSCFHQILEDHHRYLNRLNIKSSQLMVRIRRKLGIPSSKKCASRWIIIWLRVTSGSRETAIFNTPRVAFFSCGGSSLKIW
ncbi:MAG: hypothetical protein HC767_05830 [Akkermansiaceae bacterium]|nr:hypothetical protein [Akkermansiaceae bacterium]